MELARNALKIALLALGRKTASLANSTLNLKAASVSSQKLPFQLRCRSPRLPHKSLALGTAQFAPVKQSVSNAILAFSLISTELPVLLVSEIAQGVPITPLANSAMMVSGSTPLNAAQHVC